MLSERLRRLQFGIVEPVAVVDIFGPAVVDEDVIEHVRVAAQLEPDIGELAAVLVAGVLVALKVDDTGIVVERQGVVGKGRRLWTTAVQFRLRLSGVSAR